jgi:hypothetical protein
MKNEAIFEKQLQELLKELGTVSEPSYQKVVNLAQQANHDKQSLKDRLATLQESMDYLRVSVKYLIFDLEATRRENAYLKTFLDKMD